MKALYEVRVVYQPAAKRIGVYYGHLCVHEASWWQGDGGEIQRALRAVDDVLSGRMDAALESVRASMAPTSDATEPCCHCCCARAPEEGCRCSCHTKFV